MADLETVRSSHCQSLLLEFLAATVHTKFRHLEVGISMRAIGGTVTWFQKVMQIEASQHGLFNVFNTAMDHSKKYSPSSRKYSKRVLNDATCSCMSGDNCKLPLPLISRIQDKDALSKSIREICYLQPKNTEKDRMRIHGEKKRTECETRFAQVAHPSCCLTTRRYRCCCHTAQNRITGNDSCYHKPPLRLC